MWCKLPLCYGCAIELSLESGSRTHKPDDGRPDFMATSVGAGRIDGMSMKPASGWDADEAARIKSSMISRDKMVSAFIIVIILICSNDVATHRRQYSDMVCEQDIPDLYEN